MPESNWRHSAHKTDALTTELMDLVCCAEEGFMAYLFTMCKLLGYNCGSPIINKYIYIYIKMITDSKNDEEVYDACKECEGATEEGIDCEDTIRIYFPKLDSKRETVKGVNVLCSDLSGQQTYIRMQKKRQIIHGELGTESSG